MKLNIKSKAIVDSYNGGNSMRAIAESYGTNHKLISRILKKEGVETRKPLNLRGKRKFECDIDLKYNNMVTHLRFEVTIEWAREFDDFEKLKCLNDLITNRDKRYNETTEWYKSYITYFYFDDKFNSIYSRWVATKDQYMKPSIDHIIPRCKGGDNKLSNLQVLTWFENKAKKGLSQEEWDIKKANIQEYLK